MRKILVSNDTLGVINTRRLQNVAVRDILAEFNITKPVFNRLVREGLIIKSPYTQKDLDIEKLKTAYMRGDSVLKMSHDFNIARSGIIRRLKKLGYQIRTGSEANFIRFANSSKEYRMQITQKAHDKVRGSKRAFEIACRCAKSREETANKSLELYSRCGIGEIEIFKALCDKKLNPIAQKAFEVYNIDLFVSPNTFIEVSCDPHPLKSQCVRKRNAREFVKKAKKITQNKGILIEINFQTLNILNLFLNDIVAFIKQTSLNPALCGKHFVVACYNKNLAPNGKFNKIGGYFAPCPKKPFWEVIEIDTLSFN